MLIPYGTDAPIYHYPVTTVGIMVVNVVLFCATGMGLDLETFHWLILEFDKINPLQWVTAAFMHAGWMHLIGNMIFLWTFGLIVEGKLGWWKFLLLYLGLALADGAICQIPMYLLVGGENGALGASGVIFALVAVALIWAPDNEVGCILFLTWFYIRDVSIRILYFALFFLGKELLIFILISSFAGVQMSTPLLHLLGMFVGFPFAIYMLKMNYVDCEGWDALTRYGGGNPLMIPLNMLSGSATNTGNKTASDIRIENEKAYADIMKNPHAFNPGQRSQANATPSPSVPTGSANGFATAVQSGNLAAARGEFNMLVAQQFIHLANETDLIEYVKLLSKYNLHSESLFPLQQLVSRGSSVAGFAQKRINAIQQSMGQGPL